MFTKGFEKIAGLKDIARSAGKWMKNNPVKTMAGAAAAGTALHVGGNMTQGKGLRQSLTSSWLAPKYEESK